MGLEATSTLGLQLVLESRAWRPHPAPPAEAICSRALALAPVTRIWPEL